MVGGGKMAQHHARAVARCGVAAKVVGVVDPSPDAQAAMRAIAPEAAGFATLAEALAAMHPAVVHIVTPPATHAALTRTALEAGCHVYVEKPFVEHGAEARDLLDLAASRQRLVCAGHQLLQEAPSRIARELRPAIGKLVHVESYFSFRTVRRTPDGRAPLRADLQLLDILPHPVYVLLAALDGEADGPTELTAVEVGPPGTVHALIRRGGISGTLTVSLQARPVESFLRLTGTNGTINADYVRGTVQRLIGPGTSGLEKLFAPYQIARQLVSGTTRAMAKRFLGGQRSYPGLAEVFGLFYGAIRSGGPSPVSPENIADTVAFCERIGASLATYAEESRPRPIAGGQARAGRVVLTGGTGFLGRATTKALLAAGHPVTVLARRTPAPWDQFAGVDYRDVDLGLPIDPAHFMGATAVINAAAETAGSWEQHQRNSIDATRHVLTAAHAAGIREVVHVSSVAVLAPPRAGQGIRDDGPLKADSRASGPYVWGKLESERLAVTLAAELGMTLRVARPGAIVDYTDFDPPGRLGKRVGGFYVAVGSPGQRLGVVDVTFCGEALAWILDHPAEAPTVINILQPTLPSKRELIAQLRSTNPDLTVLWLPGFILHPLSWAAILLQKLLRPGRPAMNVASVFAVDRWDNTRSTQLAAQMRKPPAEAAASVARGLAQQAV